MGSDAEVYDFDESAYLGQVVPFLRGLLRAGRLELTQIVDFDRIRPHMGKIQRHLDDNWPDLRPTDLDAHCTYLGRDFRALQLPDLSRSTLKDHHGMGWEGRACRRAECPASPTCPFFGEGRASQAEAFSILLQSLAAWACLGDHDFVGRSFNVFQYDPVFVKYGIAWDGELGRLLTDLGTRGAVVGYSFANSDGIHGWLSHEETGRLLSILAALPLPLPRPGQADPAMEGREDDDPDHDWEGIFLGVRLRSRAELAWAAGRGILWANDLSDFLGREYW